MVFVNLKFLCAHTNQIIYVESLSVDLWWFSEVNCFIVINTESLIAYDVASILLIDRGFSWQVINFIASIGTFDLFLLDSSERVLAGRLLRFALACRHCLGLPCLATPSFISLGYRYSDSTTRAWSTRDWFLHIWRQTDTWISYRCRWGNRLHVGRTLLHLILIQI